MSFCVEYGLLSDVWFILMHPVSLVSQVRTRWDLRRAGCIRLRQNGHLSVAVQVFQQRCRRLRRLRRAGKRDVRSTAGFPGGQHHHHCSIMMKCWRGCLEHGDHSSWKVMESRGI